MKKIILGILLLISVNIAAVAHGMETFNEKVIYTHTAERVPSRVSVVMVPQGETSGYSEDDVFGITGDVFTETGKHELAIYPRESTPSGIYTLIIKADDTKSTLDIEWLTERDKNIRDALAEINAALYQNIAEVIRKHADLMPSDFSMSAYDALHVDYQVSAMKALAANYTFTSMEHVKESFNTEVSRAASGQNGNHNRPSYGGGGGGGGGGSSSGISAPVAPPVNTDDVFDNAVDTKESFSDLSDYDWAKEAIETLSKRGVVSGDGEGRFLPQNQVNRAEFSAMLVRLLEIQDDTAEAAFDDVKQNDWFYVYVASAKKEGIINGRSEVQFSPMDSITRAEAVIMIHNVLSKKSVEFNGEETADFSDIEMLDESVQQKIADTASLGVILGRDGNTFAPQDNLTRAEAAVIINRIIKYV